MFDVLYGILRHRDTLPEQDCSPEEEDVIDRLKDVNFLECSDDRDRLYALLSLQNNHIMEADYTLSTVEVYVRFATYVIREKRSEMIFDNCHVGDANQRLLGLPSWVPDLRNPFRAAKYTNEDRWGEVLVDDHNVLKYNAKHLGRVTAIDTEATGVFDGRCSYLTIADRSHTPSDQPDHPSVCRLQIQGEGGARIMVDDVICTAIPTNTEHFWPFHVLRGVRYEHVGTVGRSKVTGRIVTNDVELAFSEHFDASVERWLLERPEVRVNLE